MSTKQPFCVIYNPSAGRGRTTRTWQTIQRLLGKDAEYRPTERKWHAAELAQRAAEGGFATVVAAGGDGTVHEVINGLLRSGRSDVAFGVLPLGSGNDYARLIQTPFDSEGMVHRLRSDAVWSVDAGCVTLDGKTEQYFCNTLGMGLGGAVTWEASKIRWLRGIPLYGLASVKAIFKHFCSVKVKMVDAEGSMETSLVYAVAALGKAEGGGFVVAPEAILDDGLFNLMYVSQITRFGAMLVLPRLVIPWLRKGCRLIQERKVGDMQLVFDQPMPVHADGEVIASPQEGARECVIKMLPGRLRIRGKPAT